MLEQAINCCEEHACSYRANVWHKLRFYIHIQTLYTRYYANCVIKIQFKTTSIMVNRHTAKYNLHNNQLNVHDDWSTTSLDFHSSGFTRREKIPAVNAATQFFATSAR